MGPVWNVPPSMLPLIHGQVHIFRMKLDGVARVDLGHLLDSHEQARSQRFLFEIHRTRFINTHIQTRQILGYLLGVDPASLAFTYNEYGKPALTGSSLRFNISHSQDWGLLAATLDQEIGVDIEVVRHEVNRSAIAARFFAPQEVQELQSLPESKQAEGFFHCWTRKEAYIKARGLGLKIPLRQFTVSVDPDQPARLLNTEPGAPSTWTAAALDPGPGFCGAVVVEGKFQQVLCWDWPFP